MPEVLNPPGARVTGGRKPPDVGAVSISAQTEVSGDSEAQEPYSSEVGQCPDRRAS